VTNLIKNVQSRFKNNKIVRCPRCLNDVEIPNDRAHFQCPEKVRDQFWQPIIPCGYEFPPLYVQNYGGETKPVFVQVFGWTTHGKTVYLDALRLMLMNLGAIWNQYTYQSLTDRDIDLSKKLRTKLEVGIMPDATAPLNLHDNYIYIMQVSNLLRWGSRFFVMMDHAGERFDSLEEFQPNEIPFLTHRGTTTLMFLSPALLRGSLIGEEAAQLYREKRDAARQELPPPERKGNDFGRSMNDLLTIYIQAMIMHDKHEMAAKPKGFVWRVVDNTIKQIIQQRRKLVVVLTMSDMLINEMPEQLRNYLTTDDMWDQIFDRANTTREEINVEFMDRYMDRLERVSNAVREWLRSDLQDIGGADFVKNIENNNIEARYTIVSALGHNEVSLPAELRGSGSKITPKRVLDPFFWILDLERKILEIG